MRCPRCTNYLVSFKYDNANWKCTACGVYFMITEEGCGVKVLKT